MNTKLLFSTALALWLLAGATPCNAWCIQTSDVCCNSEYSENTGHINSTSSTWYVFYESTDECNQVEVIVEVDGTPEFHEELCDCGTATLSNMATGNLAVKLKVKCSVCLEGGICSGCASGTAVVKLYSPSADACQTDCDPE